MDCLTQRIGLPDNWRLGAEWNNCIKQAKKDIVPAAEFDNAAKKKADSLSHKEDNLDPDEYVVERIIKHKDKKVLVSRKDKKKKYDLHHEYLVH